MCFIVGDSMYKNIQLSGEELEKLELENKSLENQAEEQVILFPFNFLSSIVKWSNLKRIAGAKASSSGRSQ